MKKIMTLAAVAAAGVAFAAVESDNIVGYQTLDAVAGFTFVSPSFAGVTSDYGIQGIQISGENVTGWGAQTLQILDSEGNVPDTNQYAWYNAGEAGEAAGWYDGDGVLATKTFGPGESFLISNDDGAYTITFAGQVNFTAIPAYAANTGYTCVGNMTPVAKGIQKYAIAGENVSGWGAQTLQIIDDEGNVTDANQYAWYNAGEAGENAGWYDGDGVLATREFAAGQGFLISNDDGEYTINLPATND